MPPKRPIASNTNVALEIPLFREVSIDRHRKDVSERKDACAHDEFAATSTARLIEERKQRPDKPRGTEYENADDFTVREPQLCGNLFKRLKHEHEVPLGTDARGRGREGIRLRSQLPGQDRSQCPENAECD